MLQPTSDQDSGYGELLEPPPSLWKLVEDQVPCSERDEIKRILGEGAVDLSLDLHAEISVLLDLWRDVRSTSLSAVQIPQSGCSILADPPVIKDMVTQEIRMLLLSVRMKARHQGLDEDLAMSKYNPRVLNFVMGMRQPESRARSRASGWSRPSSGYREAEESIEDDLEKLKDKLQICHINEVIHHLRSLLDDECRTLEKDIKILQDRLEEEHQDMEEELQAEPSLTELKEERRILERDLKLHQYPAASLPTSKMASRRPNPPRSLDLGRRGGDAERRHLPDVPQRAPHMTPCPPDPKMKSPEGRRVGKGLTGPRALSCDATSSLRGSEEPGQSAPQRLERASVCDWMKGPERGVPSHRTALPNDEATAPRPLVTPVSALLVPLPPKVQRPPGSPGPAPSFRRVRTKVANLPP
ncbi:coiled-coil domain-containing protein 24 isoform X2 [Hyla sarda]|uniref:coiled-coil domain-containing protein 24 isoform X2 n=1 Tax=Hyla sarda TaxID=327740 RepID=UPI0024C41524|nr:coiled-coil domain-containing protein 24 isoform X2 [Hyla sarda]